MTEIEIAALSGWIFAGFCFLAWVRRCYKYAKLAEITHKLTQELANTIIKGNNT